MLRSLTSGFALLAPLALVACGRAPSPSSRTTPPSDPPVTDSSPTTSGDSQASPAAAANSAPSMSDRAPEPASADAPTRRTELATLGAGCFWCVEAVYEQLPGVLRAESGYMGGHVENPTYEQVCGKKTGHVEVVQIEFDPAVIPFSDVLDWFWRLHDPTSLDRQGADAGPQYRSVVFFHSAEQERVARESMAAAQPSFPRPIVTEVRAATTFWPAEGYHQGFYADNPRHGYCRMVIAPKLEKLGLSK